MQTLFIGQSRLHYPCCDSTNRLLKEKADQENLAEGFLLSSGFQTAGKGQGSHVWQSAPDANLLASLLLRPVWLPSEKSFLLNMAVSLGVRECVEVLSGKEAQIKWPNDILVNDHKIAGLLIENVFSGSAWKYAVCGVGLNVQQTDFGEIPYATSLQLLTGKTVSLHDVSLSLCYYIEKYYLQLKKHHHHFLEKAYTQSLWRFQHTSPFRIGSKVVEGEIEGVDNRGRLGVRIQGNIQFFTHGHIEYVRETSG